MLRFVLSVWGVFALRTPLLMSAERPSHRAARWGDRRGSGTAKPIRGVSGSPKALVGESDEGLEKDLVPTGSSFHFAAVLTRFTPAVR